jgi:hypothetical protein
MAKANVNAVVQQKNQVEFMPWNQYEKMLRVLIRSKVPGVSIYELFYDLDSGTWSFELYVESEEVAPSVPAIEALSKIQGVSVAQVLPPRNDSISKNAKCFHGNISGSTAQQFFDEAIAAEFPGFTGELIVTTTCGVVLVGTTGDPAAVRCGKQIKRVKGDVFERMLCAWAEEKLPGFKSDHASVECFGMLSISVCPAELAGKKPDGYARFDATGDFAKYLVSEVISGMQSAD